jgi:hypothetical protein
MQRKPKKKHPVFLTDLTAQTGYAFDIDQLGIGGSVRAIIPLNFEEWQTVFADRHFKFESDTGGDCPADPVYLGWKFVFTTTVNDVELSLPIPGLEHLRPVDGVLEIRIKNTTTEYSNGEDTYNTPYKKEDALHFKALYSLLKRPAGSTENECYPVLEEYALSGNDRLDAAGSVKILVGGLYTCMGGGGGG